MKQGILKLTSGTTILTLLVMVGLPALFVKIAQAAPMTETVVRLDRMAAGTTGGTVCAKPATASTEASVQVTFPTGFTVNGTPANWTVTTTDLPLGATAWVGIGTATAVASQTVTFPSGELAVGTLYCFNFSGTTTLTSVAGDNQTGTVVTRDSGPATIDTGTYALSIVSSGSDLIVISATVPPIFTYALSGNTDAFTANLSSSSVVSTSGRTLTIGTNAALGWTAWVKSANAALNSASASATIATAGSIDGSPSNLDPTLGYVLDVDATTQGGGTGTMTIAGEYNGTTAEEGGTLSTTFQPIASSAGTTDGDVATLTERAFIAATQAAATDYTDTLTVVAAGLF